MLRLGSGCGEAQDLDAEVAHFGVRPRPAAAASRHSRWRPFASPSQATWRPAPRAHRATCWRRTPAPGRAGGGLPRAGSVGADRRRRASTGRFGIGSAAGAAGGKRSSKRASVPMSAPSTGSASSSRQSSPHRQRLVDEHACLRLAHVEAQTRIALLQWRQDARQEIRRERRDNAELERTAQHVAMAGEVDEVARGGEDTLSPFRHLAAGVGEAIAPGRRSINSAPISRSSARTCIDSAGWLTAQSAAARPKCPWRATEVR